MYPISGGYQQFASELAQGCLTCIYFLNATGQLQGMIFAGGFCPTVGIAGFLLGGGLGPLARQFGLGIDNVLAMEMVTANGSKVVIASATENTDLYWGLRGGGHANFGVVTSFTLMVHPPSLAPQYVYGEYCVSEILAEIQASLLMFAERLQQVPNWVSITWRLTKFAHKFDRSNTNGLCYLFYSQRGRNETEAALANIIGPVKFDTFEFPDPGNPHPRNFLVVFKNFLELELTNAQFKGYSQFFDLPLDNRHCVLQTLSPDVTRTIVNYWYDAMPDPQTTGIGCHIQGMPLGGGVADTFLPRDTAFPWRGYAFASDAECDYSDARQETAVTKFVEGYVNALSVWCEGQYVNFPIRDLDDFEEAYWSNNAPQLRQLKAKWNPSGGVISFPQQIK